MRSTIVMIWSRMISTIGEKSIAPVLGIRRRIGRSSGSRMALIAVHTASTAPLWRLTTLNASSRLSTNWMITAITITLISRLTISTRV